MKVTELMARQIIEERTTEELIEMWEKTTTDNREEVPTLRGWLMDEFARRNPEGFDEWLDGDAEDETLKNYILK